jgi:MFS family permease
VVIPFALRSTGNLDINHHWEVYLPVVVIAFIVMVPAIIYGEKRAKLKQVFVAAVALMLMAQIGMAASMQHFWGIVGALLAYFIAFNVLEATLPSLISKIAPVGSKGTAIGVYNTSQSIGLFVGGAVGGWLSQHYGYPAVFMFSAGLMALWLIAAVGMRTPPAVKTRMFRLGVLTVHQAEILNQKLRGIQGVYETTVVAQEGIAIMKVGQLGWDEASATKLIEESRNGVSK